MTVIINGTTGVTTPADSISGNLGFTGTGNRITGDFSNATVANRVMFQTSTTNSGSVIGFLPNGTGTNSRIQCYNSSSPGSGTNSIFDAGVIGTTDVRLQATYEASGTALPMTFYTGGSESLRLSKDYKTVILSGGSTSANGTGITFPATQSASTDANTLDDYEEGTWTPTLLGGANSPTYTFQNGRYVKIGQVVSIWLDFQLASGTANSSQFEISGLPFQSYGYAPQGGAYINYQTGFKTDNLILFHIQAGTSKISTYKPANGSTFLGTDATAITGRLILCGQYYTA